MALAVEESMIQPDLFSYTPPIIFGSRDGQTFDAKRDGARLNKQAQDVFDYMTRHNWSTLYQISYGTGHPEASVSARLRDLRKPKFGGHKVERRYVVKGMWQYRVSGKSA